MIESLNLESELARVIALANAFRVSFYPIKAPPGDALGAQDRLRAGSRGADLTDMRRAFLAMADGTGGLAHVSETESDGFLERLLDDTVATTRLA